VRLLQVRLRVPIALLIAALVVGRWDVIRNHWDRLTQTRTMADASMRTVSNDTEYFCPMDPGVVTDWPGKCGICQMALVVRKKGDATMLPDGVIARMQLAPYRVQLAGILTAPAAFRPLECSYETEGVVERTEGRARVLADLAARRAPWIAEGQRVAVRCRDLPGLEPCAGAVKSLTRLDDDGLESLRVVVAIEGPDESLRSGMAAALTFRVPAAAIEPFCSQPADPPARSGEPVQVYACLNHPEAIGLESGRCPVDRQARVARPLNEQQRVRWWCPMHPGVTADRPGASCEACGGMALQPRVVTFLPRGQVLSVPESAVVDTGARTVVFVESMPGTFDGVEVVLGPRCGDDFPVVRGLEPGQKVAIKGAFLLDAETRLNPSLAAGYFGAARDQAATSAAVPGVVKGPSHEPTAFDALSPDDRLLARQQRVCPVTRKPLGSMGTLERVEVAGRTVFLCCAGCEARLRRDPARYLAELSQADAKRP
jgi:hypothetical protein